MIAKVLRCPCEAVQRKRPSLRTTKNWQLQHICSFHLRCPSIRCLSSKQTPLVSSGLLLLRHDSVLLLVNHKAQIQDENKHDHSEGEDLSQQRTLSKIRRYSSTASPKVISRNVFSCGRNVGRNV